MTDIISPGSTIGVLGSGQLGRMFAIAARRLGYRVHVLSPDQDTPTGQVADLEINADYLDLDAIERLARSVDVVSFEFENVPFETVQVVERFAPVRPSGNVLHITQNRWREKSFLKQAGIPVTPFQHVQSLDELKRAFANQKNRPGVLKTSSWGYDGKGQVPVRGVNDLENAWKSLQTDDAILEEFIDFSCEISVIAARSIKGDVAAYQPFGNTHQNHILDITVSPAQLPASVAAQAEHIAGQVLTQLNVVGVLCVEFFVTYDGQLLVNELAPRPHNSGHLTIDAHVSCQFEQQVRAVCGLPLGSIRQLRPAAMANLLGDLWSDGEPNWDAVCGFPEVKLHLYGKQHPRPGRKMGHLVATADSVEQAQAIVQDARNAFTAKTSA
ncbi:MAG: 5-(carboxyamino)imidazole ribonucleotide synthase [Planctomycetota bacterium]|nr:5-(carboxyamino)imidazole ribonucleotide synthase [Planctomycetota bacterium]MDA1179409.1 5-(carboxyamino)imidazole ribonucleotide synthase [Planctomycetota bacterium]